MDSKIKIGIIICDRYHNCAGGKCLRAFNNREGAFSVYRGKEVELAGYATCGGCPGGNIENSLEEMKKNGVQVVHLATGFFVGYPPCPHLAYFQDFIREKDGLKLVFGTHPIPQKYYKMHLRLGTWSGEEWQKIIYPTLTDEKTRLSYD